MSGDDPRRSFREAAKRAIHDAHFREVVEQVMRDDGADEATIAAALANLPAPQVVFARARITSGAVPLTPDGLDHVLRILPGGANQGGRDSELESRLAEYREAILALSNEGYPAVAITTRVVLARLHRTGSESQLHKDTTPSGGWKAFRAEVLRRLSGG
jgi:hypothetical protein